MVQEKQIIELTIEEISMIMDGLNRAQVRYAEMNLPDAFSAYGKLWSRFYSLQCNSL